MLTAGCEIAVGGTSLTWAAIDWASDPGTPPPVYGGLFEGSPLEWLRLVRREFGGKLVRCVVGGEAFDFDDARFFPVRPPPGRGQVVYVGVDCQLWHDEGGYHMVIDLARWRAALAELPGGVPDELLTAAAYAGVAGHFESAEQAKRLINNLRATSGSSTRQAPTPQSSGRGS